MVYTGPGMKKYSFPPGRLLLFSAFFFVPALNPSLFWWLNGLLAVPVFYLFTVNGVQSATAQLRISLLIAGIVALLVQQMEIFLFSLTLIPLGYSLYTSANARESAAVSGGKGVVVLFLTWLLFWSVYGVVMGINPYKQLLAVLDLGFQQTLEVYGSKEAGLSPEMVYNLHQVTSAIRETIPKLMPGLLASVVVITVWFNMLLANSLISRLRDTGAPWGRYSTWRLPEQLVWMPIAAVIIMLLSSGTLQHVSGWIVLISVLLYFFQGLAVFITLMERWKVPVYVRYMLYVVLIIQSYGVILLAFLGISDVWLNFRKKTEQK